MTKTTRNIIIISSAVLIIGVGAYLYMQKRKRNRITKNSESEEGKEVKEWDDLVKNIVDYIPDGAIKTVDSRTADGDKLAKKVFPYYHYGLVDKSDPTKAIRVSAFYYADGDFRIYEKLWNAETKKDKSTWIGSGKWINDKGTKVYIEPKEKEGVYKIEKGTYEGIDIKDMLTKIFKRPVGYYNPTTKVYQI